MSLLADSALKVAVILLLALLVVTALRRQSAAVRHWVLAVSILCAFAVPLFGVVVPWHVSLPALAPVVTNEPSSVSSTSVFLEPSGVDNSPSVVAAPTARPGRSLPWARLFGAVWIGGAVVNLLILGIGLTRLRRLTSRARSMEGERWASTAREVSRAIGLSRPVRILQSDDRLLLVTWGLVRPKVLLPPLAVDWPEERVRVVLQHELTHVVRGDWAFQMAAELLRALHWFNPLAWVACRRLRQESEYASDDEVLNGGVHGQDYASHLVDLARAVNVERRAWLPAPAMARPSSLEGRVQAMLNPHVDRRPPTRSWRAAMVVALLSVAAPIAAAQGSFFTFSGVVVDQTNGVLPGVSLALTNAERKATYQVQSDDAGRFAFVGLPGGDYALEVQQVGFASLRDNVGISGRNVNRTLQLQVGSLEESMTVSSAGRQSVEPADALEARRQRAQERSQRALETCHASTVGGSILAPIPLVHVNPVYPESSKTLGVGGIVKMEALVGTDGTITDVRVLDPKQTDLEDAAVEAVRQWQFSPTLLNCTPIEVKIRITSNFVARPTF